MDPELFPEEQGIYTYSTPGTPTLGICTGDKGPKVSSFGNQWGFISRRHRWGVAVGDMIFALGPSANAEIREVPELNVKEIYLLILKHLLEGQGWVGISLGMEALASNVFALSLTQVGSHRHRLTKAVGMSHPQCTYPAFLKLWMCPTPRTLPKPHYSWWVAQYTQEMYLNHLALVARNFALLRPWDCNNQKDSSGRPPHPGALFRQQIET